MSTTFEITYGGKVSVQSIAHTICRIGSNPSLELCMDGIAEHAATLRIQNGKRVIYNRSGKPILLSGKQVQHDQTSPWGEGQLLELADDIRIRLMHDRKANLTVAPHRRDDNSLVVTRDSASVSDVATEKKKSRVMIFGFLIVFATILFSSDSTGANKARDEAFAQVINGLLAAENEPNAGCYQQVRINLQNAMLRPNQHDDLIHDSRRIIASNKAVKNDLLDAQVMQFIKSYF